MVILSHLMSRGPRPICRSIMPLSWPGYRRGYADSPPARSPEAAAPGAVTNGSASLISSTRRQVLRLSSVSAVFFL